MQAAKDSGGKVTAIWVDTDGCVSAAEYCSVLLTSAEKGLAVSVKDAIKSALDKKFSNALFIGTLQNNGVGFAPYHDFDNTIPSCAQEQGRKGEGRPHQREDQDRLAFDTALTGRTVRDPQPCDERPAPMHLELRGLTKRFGSFVANDHIDLTVEPGEIHCLLGENGAGKTTLMNMLYGLLKPDDGEILLDGEPVRFAVSR